MCRRSNADARQRKVEHVFGVLTRNPRVALLGYALDADFELREQQQLVLQRKLRDPSRPFVVASLAPAARLSLTKQRQLVRLRKLRLLLERSPATDQWRRLAASA